MTEIMFISYHDSKPLYIECGKQLERSLIAANVMPYFIETAPGTDWNFGTACAYKPGFIVKCMEMFSKYDRFVYLDSDSVIMQYPSLFSDIPDEYDMATHYRNGQELLAGVLYFRRSPAVMDFLMEWSRLSYDDIRTWEQKHLQKLVETSQDIKVYRLPPEYCQIFDLMAGQGGEPVIKQMQASRLSRGIDLNHNPIVGEK